MNTKDIFEIWNQSLQEHLPKLQRQEEYPMDIIHPEKNEKNWKFSTIISKGHIA